ncbi:MAG: sortase domain-containing protein [Actinomycetes bacterium]
MDVRRRDGRTAMFRVTRVTQVPKHAFPTERVYGYTDYAALRLITCGGTYLEDENRYLDNIVVYAHLDPSAGEH